MATIDDWFDEATLMELVPIDVYVRGASAVEAGAEAAKGVGEVIAVQVIPRPHEELVNLGKWLA